jgi:GNAT superfamily N-acetyltransferase
MKHNALVGRAVLTILNAMIGTLIRRPNAGEENCVRSVVQTVVDELYGGLWGLPAPLPIDEEDWSAAWVAVIDTRIVGMILTINDWLSDLWVLRENRGQGVGKQLLAQGEAEIAGRGHETFRLRVVKSNAHAVAFYLRHDWKVVREFPNERLPLMMLEMSKSAHFLTFPKGPILRFAG